MIRKGTEYRMPYMLRIRCFQIFSEIHTPGECSIQRAGCGRGLECKLMRAEFQSDLGQIPHLLISRTFTRILVLVKTRCIENLSVYDATLIVCACSKRLELIINVVHPSSTQALGLNHAPLSFEYMRPWVFD